MKFLTIFGLFVAVTVAHAASSSSEAHELVRSCESGKYFFAIPFVPDRALREEMRSKFYKVISQFPEFAAEASAYTTVRFAPKEGSRLNRRQVANLMEDLLEALQPLLTENNPNASGGIFCVTTFDLP